MAKPATFDLIGGLTPRYLVAARPPVVPAHAGRGHRDRPANPS
jgi:hypothetical protein